MSQEYGEIILKFSTSLHAVPVKLLQTAQDLKLYTNDNITGPWQEINIESQVTFKAHGPFDIVGYRLNKKQESNLEKSNVRLLAAASA